MTLLRILRGLSSGRCFLSCTPDGVKVDLWTVDDGSGRQQWILEKANRSLLDNIPDVEPVYHIIISGGVNSDRRYLSCTPDGLTVDLWHGDNQSGRQQWSLQEIGNQLYRISASGVNSDRRYLSCTPDGLIVDLWTVDDGSGRQQWLLQ